MKNIELILKARRGNNPGRQSRAKLHPVLVTVQGKQGAYQSIRWQSLEEAEHKDNKRPSYEDQDRFETHLPQKMSANVRGYVKNWSVNKFRTEYLKVVKEENNAKRMVDNARATRNQTQIKEATKAYNSARAKKSQIKNAAEIRKIDIEGFLEHVLEFHREKQRAAGERVAVVAPDATEDAAENALPTMTLTERGLELTPYGQQVLTSDAWERLLDDEEAAFDSAVIYALPSDMRGVEQATRDNLEWQNGKYTGEVSIGLNGEAVPEGKGVWNSTTRANGYERSYEGTWASGQWQGEGLYTVNAKTPYGIAKTVYKGGFKQNLYHGRGVLINYAEQGEEIRRYEGVFVNGVPSGQGVLTYPTGVERGNFINGELTGRGSIENNETGEYREGLFARGELNGEGKIIFSDDTTLAGVFKQGEKHGKFEFTDAQGNVSNKYFVNNAEVTPEQWREQFGANSKETLSSLGYSTRAYDEQTVASNFAGVDLEKLYNTVKGAIGNNRLSAFVDASTGTNGAELVTSFSFGDDGKLIRRFTRNLTTGKLNVAHSYFKMPDNMQGQGGSKKIMGEMLRQYKSMGVDKVSVSAGLTGGGYTWALYGFHNPVGGKQVYEQFLNPTGNRLREVGVTQARLRSFIEDIGETKYQALVKFCNNWPEGKPFPMHVIANQFGATGKAGANLLRGSQWQGVIDMADPKAVTQWENYVSPQKLAERDNERRSEMRLRAAQVAEERANRGSGRRREIIEEL